MKSKKDFIICDKSGRPAMGVYESFNTKDEALAYLKELLVDRPEDLHKYSIKTKSGEVVYEW